MTTHLKSGTALKSLWNRIGLGEMQCIVAGTMGRDLANEHLEDILRPQLEDGSSTLRQAMRLAKCGVSSKKLLKTIAGLDPAEVVVLQTAVASLHAETSVMDLFAEGRYLPDASVLRNAGFAAAASNVASGYCVIVLHDDNFHWEQPLRHEPGTLEPQDGYSLEESAKQAVDIAKLAGHHPTQQDNRYMYYVCHQLALKTGWRYFRVVDKDGSVSVVQIEAQALRHDLADGSLSGISIAGVNAPLS